MTKAAKKKRAGRKAIPIDHNALLQLASLQCTEEELAAFFECSKRTIIRKLKDQKLRDLYERGRNLGKISLRRLQLRHAKGVGSGAVNMTIHLSKHHLKEHERSLNLTVQMDDLDTAIRELEGQLADTDEAAADA